MLDYLRCDDFLRTVQRTEGISRIASVAYQATKHLPLWFDLWILVVDLRIDWAETFAIISAG